MSWKQKLSIVERRRTKGSERLRDACLRNSRFLADVIYREGKRARTARESSNGTSSGNKYLPNRSRAGLKYRGFVSTYLPASLCTRSRLLPGRRARVYIRKNFMHLRVFYDILSGSLSKSVTVKLACVCLASRKTDLVRSFIFCFSNKDGRKLFTWFYAWCTQGIKT